jgi:hypothetical protein
MIGRQKNKMKEDKHWWLTPVILTTQRSGRSQFEASLDK